MADDLYDYLIGAPPTPGDQQKAVAQTLRRRRAFGELGALTGDRVLQPFGQGQIAASDAAAKQLQDEREKAIDDAQTQEYQRGQLGHMTNVENLTRRGQDLEHEVNMLRAQADLDRANNANKPKNNKFTQSDRVRLEGLVNNIQTMQEAKDSFNDEYTQILGPGPLSKLPNTLVAAGVGTKNMEDASQWWANWKAFYTIQNRNKMFGATLTPHEKEAWEEADINPSMKPNVIRARIDKLQKTFTERAALTNRTYRQQFGDETIEPYGLPGDEEAGLTPPGSAPAAKGGGLTAAEQAELEALRAKHPRAK